MEEKTPFFPERELPNKKTQRIASFEKSSAWKNADVAFNIVNFEYPIMHKHEHWELFIISKGEIIHNINGKSIVMRKADACLIRPDDEHNLIYLNRNNNYWHINFLIKTLHIKNIFSQFGANLGERLLAEPKPLTFDIPEMTLERILNKCLQIQTLETENIEWNVVSCKLLVGELINVFLSQYFPLGKDYPEWLNSFLKRLNSVASFGEDSDTLAKHTPYVYSHLSRLFKLYTGATLNQYINHVKINHAKELLLHTNQTILEISGKLCFDSPSHLNHIFKAQTGMTPSEFKKLNSR